MRYKGIVVTKTSHTRSTDRRKTSPLRKICLEAPKCYVQLQNVYPETDDLFQNEAARKVFRIFRKHKFLEDDICTVHALIKIDEVTLGRILSYCLVGFYIAKCYIYRENRKLKTGVVVKRDKIRAQLCGFILLLRSNSPWKHLVTAAFEAFLTCPEAFKNNLEKM